VESVAEGLPYVSSEEAIPWFPNIYRYNSFDMMADNTGHGLCIIFCPMM